MAKMDMTPEHQWNYNFVIEQAELLEKSINEGNWEGYSENLKERKEKLKVYHNYIAHCEENNTCPVWLFCDFQNFKG